MIDAEKLVRILWRPFLDQIKTGDPIFFCFNREMLSELFSDEGIEFQDPADIVHRSANSFLIIVGDEVDIKRDIFKKGSSGLSASIILVCQQILIVEDMVRDSKGFSEHAYFPRLREKISEELSSKSLNPFSFDDFEEIWRQFASDIQKIEGGSEKTITFHFGVERGINKARSFPLSQALLSREDLLILVRKIGHNEVKTLSQESLWHSIRRARLGLRRRPQRLLALPILRDRIVDQIRNFALSIDYSKILIEASIFQDGAEYAMGLFKEQLDWQTDEYRIFLSQANSSKRIYDEHAITRQVDEALNKKGFLILPPNDVGDVWYKRRQNDIIEHGEMFLILGHPNEIKRAVELLKKLGIVIQETEKAEYPVGGRANELIAEFRLHSIVRQKVVVFDGALLPVKHISAVESYEWTGGVCVNHRTHKYLPDYLPEYVQFGGTQFKLSDSIKINDKGISGSIWIKNPTEFIDESGVELLFPGGRKARLSVALKNENEEDRKGFKIYENGEISPVLDRLSKTTGGIVGFNVPAKVQFPYSINQLGILLNELQQSNGTNISLNVSQEIEKRITITDMPGEVRAFLLSALKQQPKVSKEALEQLEIFV